MNPEVISPFFAIRFFEMNEANLLRPERKRPQMSFVMTTSPKKAKLQIIPENSELQIIEVSPYCNEDGSNLTNWAYDNDKNLDHYSNNFLRKMNTSMGLSGPTVETPFLRQVKQKMILLAVTRILKVERSSLSRRNSYVRSKFTTLITTTINPSIKKSVVKYITEKIKTRLDLGLEWLYKEYAIFRGVHNHSAFEEKLEDDNTITYKTLFCMLSTAILNTNEEDRGPLMMKLYTETPMVPDEAVECWKNIIPDEKGLAVMELLRNIMMEYPGKLRKFLNVLLFYSNHEMAIIRKGSVALTMDFYGNPIFTSFIQDYALLHIEYLKLIGPPPELFGKDQGRTRVGTEWTPSTVRACLALYIGIVEKYPHFIKKLERLFPSLSSIVQRMVLRYIRIPLQIFKVETPLLDKAYIEQRFDLD